MSQHAQEIQADLRASFGKRAVQLLATISLLGDIALLWALYHYFGFDLKSLVVAQFLSALVGIFGLWAVQDAFEAVYEKRDEANRQRDTALEQKEQAEERLRAGAASKELLAEMAALKQRLDRQEEERRKPTTPSGVATRLGSRAAAVRITRDDMTRGAGVPYEMKIYPLTMEWRAGESAYIRIEVTDSERAGVGSVSIRTWLERAHLDDGKQSAVVTTDDAGMATVKITLDEPNARLVAFESIALSVPFDFL